MKRMKAEQKRKLAGVIAIVLILAMVLSAAAPVFMHLTNAATASAVSTDYSIEASVGFNGVAKIGENIPVVVNVTNNSAQKLDGEVSILGANESDYSGKVTYNKYSYEVELPSNGSKRVEFNIPVKYIQKEISVELTNGKKVLKEESFPLSVGSSADCWIGLISDKPEEIAYLANVFQSTEITGKKAVELSAYVEGTSFDDFNAFDVFVVNDYDFAALSDAQINALLERVNGGAVMLLGSGSHIGSIGQLGLDNMQQVIDTETIGYDAYALGNGLILSMDVDFADVSSISNDNEVLNTISMAVGQAVNSGESFTDNLLGYTDRLPNLTDNTIKVIFGVLYLYIAFVPILYVILKKRDRRENAIKIIPVTAVALSVIIYLLSFNTVYKKPIASIVNYIDLNYRSANAVAVKSGVNVISPAKGKLEIRLDNDVVFTGVSDNSYNSSYNNYGYSTAADYDAAQNVNAEIKISDSGTVITQSNKTKWDNTYLSMAKQYRIENGFESDAKLNENGDITGTVTNGTGEDFSEAVVIAYAHNGVYAVQKVENLKNGSNYNLSELGINVFSSEPMDYYNFGDVINENDNYYARKTENLNETYRLETEQDILDGIAENLMDSDDYYSAFGINVAVIGFSDTTIVGDGIRVNNKQVKSSTVNVFKQGFSVSTDELEQANASVLAMLDSYDNSDLSSETMEDAYIDEDNAVIDDAAASAIYVQ